MVATARPGEEEAHVRALGAAETVDWSKDTAAAVRELHPDGVDGVIDLVSRDPGSFSITVGSPVQAVPRSILWVRPGRCW